MKVLLTGASGLVGHHVLAYLLDETDWTFVLPVTMAHKGSSQRVVNALQGYRQRDPIEGLASYESRAKRVEIMAHDLTMPFADDQVNRLRDVDVIMNVASESHVDRSLAEPAPFIRNNVHLMLNVLELARQIRPRLLLQMSTDEVYGPAVWGTRHVEGEPHRPSNPYSASKSAQEAICFAYWRSFGLPIVMTNTMNIFGEGQDPEKFVTKTIRALLRNEPITVHAAPAGDSPVFVPEGQRLGLSTQGAWISGSRFYLHAENLASAWLFLVRRFTHHHVPSWETHDTIFRVNVVGDLEISNDAMVRRIARLMNVEPKIEYVDFHSSRPGHDMRYALDGTALFDMGWRAHVPVNVGLERVIKWTTEHPEWLH